MVIQEDILGHLGRLHLKHARKSLKEEKENNKDVIIEDLKTCDPSGPEPEAFTVTAECWKCANKYQCEDCEQGLKEPLIVSEKPWRPFYFGCKQESEESLKPPGAPFAADFLLTHNHASSILPTSEGEFLTSA